MSEKTALSTDALDAVTGGELSDMSQMESMRLQNVMDRRSKFCRGAQQCHEGHWQHGQPDNGKSQVR